MCICIYRKYRGRNRSIEFVNTWSVSNRKVPSLPGAHEPFPELGLESSCIFEEFSYIVVETHNGDQNWAGVRRMLFVCVAEPDWLRGIWRACTREVYDDFVVVQRGCKPLKFISPRRNSMAIALTGYCGSVLLLDEPPPTKMMGTCCEVRSDADDCEGSRVWMGSAGQNAAIRGSGDTT